MTEAQRRQKSWFAGFIVGCNGGPDDPSVPYYNDWADGRGAGIRATERTERDVSALIASRGGVCCRCVRVKNN